jgi:osmotically-inducible protein OsmY
VRALVVGRAKRAQHAVGRHDHGYVDDITLVQRVESHLFRDPHVPKGRLNVDAAGGTVYLRGALPEPGVIRQIESMVAKVPGVMRLDSFLHLEGTPAPNKADALAAGKSPWA